VSKGDASCCWTWEGILGQSGSDSQLSEEPQLYKGAEWHDTL